MTSYDAVVLAGGAARRLGGADKPALPVGGLMLLDRVLAACAGARGTVVVGPRRPTARPVRWTREDPVGGGPLPALAAGLAALRAADVEDAAAGGAGDSAIPRGEATGEAPGREAADVAGARRAGGVDPGSGPGSDPAPDPRAGGRSGSGTDADPGQDAGPDAGAACAHALRGGDDDVVLVLAADLPFLTARTAAALVGALEAEAGTGADIADAEQGGGGDVSSGGRWEGVMLTDSGGRDQPLAAAYRAEPLRRELALLEAEHGRLSGLPLRFLTGELRLRRIADPTGEASFDCDTWEDVAAARARFAAHAEGPDESER